MALTLSTAARNAACDGVVDLVDGGSSAGQMVIQDSDSAVLARFTLSNPAFGSADSGIAALDSDPAISDTSAEGTGTADNAELRDFDSTVVISGLTVGTDSTYDVTIDNTSISSGQQVNLNTGTITMPAS